MHTNLLKFLCKYAIYFKLINPEALAIFHVKHM